MARAVLVWVVGVCACACGLPPTSRLDDAAVPTIDAGPVDAPIVDAPPLDGPVIDAARPDAALPDATIVDASIPDANTIDALDGNPLGIALTEVTAEFGIDYLGGRVDPDPWGVGSGAAVGDVDGDGQLDLFLARCDSLIPDGGPSTLLLQTGMGSEFPTFVSDGSMEAAFAGLCAHGAAFGDFDRDGDLDLFVTLNGSDRLYANDGSGNFTDITGRAGVAGLANDISTGAYFADFNHDGLLDLLVLGQVTITPPDTDPRDINRMYINLGDDTFRDVTMTSGVAGDGSSQAAAIADLDGDGDIEIYIANDRFAVNGLGAVFSIDADAWLDLAGYDNEGMPTYVDLSSTYHTDGPRSSMGVIITDIDDDGRDDIYVSDWGANHLQVWNSGLGSYLEAAAQWGVRISRNSRNFFVVSWGAEFTDLDRDGYVELILINGAVYDPLSCSVWTQRDHILRRLEGGFTFVDITADVGWPLESPCPPVDDDPVSGRGIVMADLDNDGDDDIVVTPFIEKYRFYRNDTPQATRHRIRLEPRGTVSAPTPYGAVLSVTRVDGVRVRRVLVASGTFTQRYPVIEAGLGADTQVTEATLSWPSGYVQRIDSHPAFAIDTTWAIVEPEWLALSRRVATQADPVPTLIYRPVDTSGAFIGPPAAGRNVTVTRSDGQPVAVVDNGDGSYSALLPHPGTARITVIRLSDDGVQLRPRLTVNYK